MMRSVGGKEVRTQELFGQIKNFMEKDRRVSIETISEQFDVSVGTVPTIIREELKMRKSCVKFVESLSQTIWRRWVSRLLVIPKAQGKPLRLSLWDNWGDKRGCDEGYGHDHRRGYPWGLPEVVGTVQHCSRRGLLWRRLEFHVSTIHKSAHKKKNLEIYIMIPIYSHPQTDCFVLSDTQDARSRDRNPSNFTLD